MSLLVGARRTLLRSPAIAVAGATAWNPADKTANLALSNSNRTVTYSIVSNTNEGIRSVAATTSNQKVYMEHVIGVISTGWAFGFAVSGASLSSGLGLVFGSPTLVAGVIGDGRFFCADSADSGEGAIASTNDGDRIGIAFDTATGEMWFRKNGAAWNTAQAGAQDPANGDGGVLAVITGSPYYAWCGMDANTSDVFTSNFASSSWVDAAPSGYTQLSA